jgi:hypothetical protein
VREELEGQQLLPPNMRKFTFYFFRRIDKYVDMGDHIRSRNAVDATNLQKGLEDALQGILFENDREVVDIRSVIVQQGHDVNPPFVIIHAERTYPHLPGVGEIPVDVLDEAYKKPENNKQSRWQDSDELF